MKTANHRIKSTLLFLSILFLGVLGGVIMTQYYVIKENKSPLSFFTEKESFYESGELKHKMSIQGIDFIKEGHVYLKNGSLEYHYYGDIMGSVFVEEYYETGELKATYNLSELVLSGAYTEYDKEENVIDSGCYKDGVYTQCDSFSGQDIVSDLTFKGFDDFEASYDVSDSKGIPILKKKYKNGKLIYKADYDSEGNLLSEK
jgi:antitoxin component YwqK of YwqJK toxin-antitoxin module